MVPSKTAMKYLHHAKVINEEDVPVGAHYRAREDMLNNVRIKIFSVKYFSKYLDQIDLCFRRAQYF